MDKVVAKVMTYKVVAHIITLNFTGIRCHKHIIRVIPNDPGLWNK